MRITPDMALKLRRRSKLTGKSASEILRDAVEAHLQDTPLRESAGALAQRLGLAGCAKGLPPDLSTNRKYFEGFGRDR